MMNDFIYNWAGPIVCLSAFFGFLVFCYFIARENPKFSRTMDKKNCNCNVCYPNSKEDIL